MSGQNIGKLKVSIGAETKDLARGIGRAKAMFGSFARAAKVTGIAAGVAFTAASAGMIAMTRHGLDFVDSQAKTARTVDGTIDGLRALQIATGDSGVALEDISRAVQIMGKRLAEADRDGFGPAYEALEMLGISAGDLMKMDVDERFAAIADRVKDLGLNAQQSGDLMRQFGVRSNEVALVLLQGSDAIKAARQEVDLFGLSISDDMASKVEVANDAMTRIGFVFEGMRNQLAVGLAPVLLELSTRFQEASVAGGPLQTAISSLVTAFSDLAIGVSDPSFINAAVVLGTNIMGAITGLTKVMGFLVDNAELAGTAMVALGGAMVWFSGPIGLAIAAVVGGVSLLATTLGDTVTAADEAALAEARLTAALDLVDIANADAVASGEARIAVLIDQGRAALEAAKAELALARAKQQAGNALLDTNPLTAGGNSGYAEAMAENTARAMAELDAAEGQLERYQKVLEGFKRSQFPSQGTPSTDAAPEKPDALVDTKPLAGLAALMAKLDPAKAKLIEFTKAQNLLTEAKEKGLITEAEYTLAMSQLKESFENMPAQANAAAAGIKVIKDQMTPAARAATQMADDISGAVGNLISQFDSGKDAAIRFGIELVRLFAVQGISNILGSSDWLGNLVSIGANALGTDNWKGGLSWVGERGPELVNLPRGAQVIPNNKLGGGGGGASFTYAPVIDARGASLAAVQELKQQMSADAVQFNSKVIVAVRAAQTKRAL